MQDLQRSSERTKIHFIVSMEKDLVAQGTNIFGSQIKGPMVLGTTNPHLEHHSNIFCPRNHHGGTE